MHAAVKRIATHSGISWRPEESLSFQEALSIYTQWAAFATNSENVLGVLQKNYKADFVVIETLADFEEDIDALLTAKIDQVYVDGKERLQFILPQDLQVQFTSSSKGCSCCSSSSISNKQETFSMILNSRIKSSSKL